MNVYFKRRSVLPFFIFFVFFTCLYSDGWTGDEQPTNIDFVKIESTGLSNHSYFENWNRDLWQGSKRSDIISLISNLPYPKHSSALQRLVIDVLVSPINSKKLVSDVEPKANKDLLSLRINKLVDIGASDKAMQLYSALNTTPPHLDLARAGVLAMLYDGKKSLACLDAHSFKEKFKDTDFWKDLLTHCDSDKKENTKRYTLKALKKLSTLETAMAFAESRVESDASDYDNANKIEQKYLLPLLHGEKTSKEHKFWISLRAARLGLLSTKKLTKTYKDLAPDSLSFKINETDISYDLPKNWLYLPSLFKLLNEQSDTQNIWTIIKQERENLLRYSHHDLHPLVEILENQSPDGALEENLLLHIYKALLHENNLSSSWTNYLKTIEKPSLNVLASLYIASPTHKHNADDLSEIKEEIEKRTNDEQDYYKNIMKTFDSRFTNVDNALEVYEKDFSLPLSQDYVIPSGKAWNRFSSLSEGNKIAESVLVSASLLGNAYLSKAYPKLLNEILVYYRDLGFKKATRAAAIEAVLEK